MAKAPFPFPSSRTPYLPTFLTPRNEFVLVKGCLAKRPPILPKSTQKNKPLRRGTGEKCLGTVWAEAGPSDSIYQWWWQHLLKWLPSALAGAQRATRVGGTATHSLHEAPQGGEHPAAGAGPRWDQAHRGRRGEKPADSWLWPFPNYEEFPEPGMAHIIFPSGLREIMRPFLKKKREEFINMTVLGTFYIHCCVI